MDEKIPLLDRQSLFDGHLVHLGLIDSERDAKTYANWTNDPEFTHEAEWGSVVRPLSAGQAKKKLAELEKKSDSELRFCFSIRTRTTDRLVGFIYLRWISLSNRYAILQVGIGQAEDRYQGYGEEAIRLALRYAFDELNLHRIQISLPSYNERALEVYKRLGFIEEIRRREAVYCCGRRWDGLILGILASDGQVAAVRGEL